MNYSLLILLMIIGSLSAYALDRYSVDQDVVPSVRLIGVATDACIFSVDGKTVVVNEKETKRIGTLSIWVKEAFTTHTTSDQNYCEALISGRYATSKKISTSKLQNVFELYKKNLEIRKEFAFSN